MSDQIQTIMSGFQNYDRNADGDPAIKSLSYLDFESPFDSVPTNARLVLVFVEKRLTMPLSGTEDLGPHLLRYKGDLRAEGFFSRFISVDLYQGGRHQDGRILLSIRSFLREVKQSYQDFLGVVLIGAFPEATLVRGCIWRPSFDITIAGKAYTKTAYLSIEPSVVASRAEIVLADLNGNWQTLYHEGPENIEQIQALPDINTAKTAWPVDGAVFSSTQFNRFTRSYRDFFWIQDDDYSITSTVAGQLQILLHHQQRHPELSATDRSLPNPIARPDILVSRINAANVAVNPNTNIKGDNGQTPLDSLGFPQAFQSSKTFPTGVDMFCRDPVFERLLLLDYFDRNHRFRIGAFNHLPFRVGAVASKEFSAADAAGYLNTASKQLAVPLVEEKATLLDYVKWFKQPAALRIIYAHSNPYNSAFESTYAIADLEQEVGGKPFRWKHIGKDYKPSFADQDGVADIFVHRTMWQNRILSNSGANLIIHGGCEVIAPAGTQIAPYYKDGYASFQNGEGILFYLNGVAMIARSKVFNDLPTGFPGALALATRAHFGEGWRAAFENDANDSNLATFSMAIRSKKSYFWSMIGDWTVRVRYRGGLGILGFAPQFAALHVHADQAWIGGWNFATVANTIRAVGDIDGDGVAEFVITSDWGLGLLKHASNIWQQVLVAPNDTWFGAWRYNASVNVGKDRIIGVGNFCPGTTREILLLSSWGIGVLGMQGTSLTSRIVRPNGTRFGGWLFDSRGNQIVGYGDMNGDGVDEIVIISDWGIGVLAASGDTFNSLMLSPNGTRFGGWLFSSRENTIRGVADFDGDGKAEILISSNWGIGILKLQGNQLISVAMHKNDSDLNGYKLNLKKSQIVAVADFNGDHASEIVVSDSDGLHLLELKNSALCQTAFLAQGQRIGGWVLNTADNQFGIVGDLDGDGCSEITVKSPWGIGILGVKNHTFSCLTLHAYGSHLGDWILEANDRIVGVGNLTGSNTKTELLIQKG